MVMELSNRRTAYFGTDLLGLVANLEKEGELQRYGGISSPKVETIALNWIEILEISPTNCRNRKKKKNTSRVLPNDSAMASFRT